MLPSKQASFLHFQRRSRQRLDQRTSCRVFSWRFTWHDSRETSSTGKRRFYDVRLTDAVYLAPVRADTFLENYGGSEIESPVSRSHWEKLIRLLDAPATPRENFLHPFLRPFQHFGQVEKGVVRISSSADELGWMLIEWESIRWQISFCSERVCVCVCRKEIKRIFWIVVSRFPPISPRRIEDSRKFIIVISTNIYIYRERQREKIQSFRSWERDW